MEEIPGTQLGLVRLLASLGTPDLAVVQYPAVCVSDTREVLPIHEGSIQDGTLIDRHGDPELMARFAAQYLVAHRALMPTGRLPKSLLEVMPALHLLVMATELALKADLMRAGIETENSHRLVDLYGKLPEDHRQEAEDRFARCEPNMRLKLVGAARPSLVEVLAVYDKSYGGGSNVYQDTRYYAEPTTKLPKSSGMQGESLLKGGTPYPVYLPHVAVSLVGTFAFFSGAARLQRLGGDVQKRARADGPNNYGGWGAVPVSLGLVAVQVLQKDRLGTGNTQLPGFQAWKALHPPGFATSWMYGGSELLFYRADENTPLDSTVEIDGIECRIWRERKLSMHLRDLFLLADAIETAWDDFEPLS